MAGGRPPPAARHLREDGGAALIVPVRLAAALRAHAGGATCVEVDVAEPATVTSVLDALAEAHPGVGRRVRDELGELRTHVNVFVGPDDVRDLDGPSTVVPGGVEVAVLAAVSGGAVSRPVQTSEGDCCP